MCHFNNINKLREQLDCSLKEMYFIMNKQEINLRKSKVMQNIDSFEKLLEGLNEQIILPLDFQVTKWEKKKDEFTIEQKEKFIQYKKNLEFLQNFHEKSMAFKTLISELALSHLFFVVRTKEMYAEFIKYGIITEDGNISGLLVKEQKAILKKNFEHLKSMAKFYDKK